MNAEVLAGLGIAPRFTFVLSDGRKAERTFAPVSAPAYSRGFGSFRMWPAGRAHARDRAAGTRLSVLAGGRVAYLAAVNVLADLDSEPRRRRAPRPAADRPACRDRDDLVDEELARRARPTAAAWFAGHDPALAAALTAPFSKARAVD
jgi:hypothetical protein